MKSIVLWFALAIAAQAQVFLPGSAKMVDAFPTVMETPSGVCNLTTPAQWIEAGGRYATAQEIAADAAAKDAAAFAQAEAEQQAQVDALTKEAAIAQAVLAVEESKKKEAPALLAAQAAAIEAGGKKPDAEKRLDIIEKVLGIQYGGGK